MKHNNKERKAKRKKSPHVICEKIRRIRRGVLANKRTHQRALHMYACVSKAREKKQRKFPKTESVSQTDSTKNDSRKEAVQG